MATEQLFAVGYAVCFLCAMKHVASLENGFILPGETNVEATIGIGTRAATGFGLTVALQIELPGVESGKAETLVNTAYEVCPYSNATRNNIDVLLSIK